MFSFYSGELTSSLCAHTQTNSGASPPALFKHQTWLYYWSLSIQHLTIWGTKHSNTDLFSTNIGSKFWGYFQIRISLQPPPAFSGSETLLRSCLSPTRGCFITADASDSRFWHPLEQTGGECQLEGCAAPNLSFLKVIQNHTYSPAFTEETFAFVFQAALNRQTGVEWASCTLPRHVNHHFMTLFYYFRVPGAFWQQGSGRSLNYHQLTLRFPPPCFPGDSSCYLTCSSFAPTLQPEQLWPSIRLRLHAPDLRTFQSSIPTTDIFHTHCLEHHDPGTAALSTEANQQTYYRCFRFRWCPLPVGSHGPLEGTISIPLSERMAARKSTSSLIIFEIASINDTGFT